MRTNIKVEREYQRDIVEVKTLWAEKEANEHLKSGDWVLLSGGIAHADYGGYQAKPCFILGRKS